LNKTGAIVLVDNSDWLAGHAQSDCHFRADRNRFDKMFQVFTKIVPDNFSIIPAAFESQTGGEDHPGFSTIHTSQFYP